MPGQMYVDEGLRLNYDRPAAGVCTEHSVRTATATNIQLMTDRDDKGAPVYANFDPAKLELNA